MLKPKANALAYGCEYSVQQRASAYRLAIQNLSEALKGTSRAAKWRATELACDAETKLLGDVEGPAKRTYVRLEMVCCYAVPPEGSELACANFENSNYAYHCKVVCPLARQKPRRT